MKKRIGTKEIKIIKEFQTRLRDKNAEAKSTVELSIYEREQKRKKRNKSRNIRRRLKNEKKN